MTRNIIIGEYQNIVLTEYWPEIVGDELLYVNKIYYKKSGFVDDYDESVSAATLTEFTHAAFRQGHSMPLRTLE